MAVKAIPDGYHSITPYLVVNSAAEVIDFIKKAFGGQELMRMPGPKGTVAHAEVKVGDSILMIADAGGAHPPRPGLLMLYVPNVDEVYKKAVAAGGKPEREPADQFYGDRSGAVVDPGGNQWWIATHVEDVPDDEMKRRAQEWASKNAAT